MSHAQSGHESSSSNWESMGGRKVDLKKVDEGEKVKKVNRSEIDGGVE